MLGEEAEAGAKRPVLPGESYTIEEFDGACPRCASAESQGLLRDTRAGSVIAACMLFASLLFASLLFLWAHVLIPLSN